MEKKRTTENQIDIFYYPNRHTHSFCLSLYIKAGALYESDEDNGITHFLEHILFRNINHLMEGNLYKEIDRLGLYFNGATYKEFMQLFIIGAPEHFTEAVQFLVKVFEPISLPAAEIKTEQQRVKAEIRESEDFKSLDYFAGTHAWKGTSLRNTILGTKGNVNTFHKKKICHYQKELFTAGNFFFYVTGCVLEEDLDQLAACLQEIPVASPLLKKENLAPIPEDFGQRHVLINVKNSRYSMVQFSYDFVTSKYTAAELALLYDVLSSGENSLMHQELSEKRGLIYSFSATLEKYNNIGRIYLTYEVSSRHIYDSISIVKEGLASLADTMEARLAYVLPEYVDNAYMIYDDNESFNWQRAYENHIMNGDSVAIEDTKTSYQAVTGERLSEIAAEIFIPQNLVLSIKGDKKRIDIEKIRKIILL